MERPTAENYMSLGTPEQKQNVVDTLTLSDQ